MITRTSKEIHEYMDMVKQYRHNYLCCVSPEELTARAIRLQGIEDFYSWLQGNGKPISEIDLKIKFKELYSNA